MLAAAGEPIVPARRRGRVWVGEIFNRALPAKPLAWTGERLTQDAGMQVELEHLHRYFLAREVARGLDVLDVAAGEGYGSAFLAQTARSVVGVDCDAASVAHASAAYGAANLRFLSGDARRLPLPDAAFDLVVSFETLEHFGEHDAFLAEVRRVLRPGGRLLLSTPERDTYSPADTAANPYHVRELSRVEFGALLRRHFAHVAVLGQRPMLGSAIFPEEPAQAAGLLTFEQRGPARFEASAGLPRAVYLLALASDHDLAALPGSLYVQTGQVEATVQAEAARLAGAEQAERAALEQDLQGLRATMAVLRNSLNTAGAGRAQLEADKAAALASLAQAEARLRATEAGLAQAEAALRASQARLAEAAAALHGSQAMQRSMQAELQDTRSRLAKAEAYGHHVQQEYAKGVAALASGASYARRVEQELAVQRGRADHAAPLLQALLLSRSWQATLPLRQLATAYPVARRTLRLAGAMLPWVRNPPATAPDATRVARASSGRGRAEPDAEPDAKAALTQALRDELSRFLQTGERLVFPVVAAPAVSVLVVLYNQAHLTLRCLQVLRAQQQQGVALEVVLVDNASTDATSQVLERLDGVRVIRNQANLGFLRGTNQAAAAAGGRNLLLLNSDAFPRPGALAAALATLEAGPRIGAVGARLVLPSGLLQEAGSIVWADGSTQGYGRGLPPEAGAVMFRREVDYCSGAFLLTPRAVWQRLGGLDDAYAPAYYEETDYCLRLREAGLRVVYDPAVAVDHYEFGSEAKQGDALEAMQRNGRRFRERHAATLLRDHLPPGPHNLLRARDAAGSRGRKLLVIDDLLPLQVNGAGLPRARAMVAGAVAAGWSVTHYPLHQPEVDWDRLRRELPATVEVIDHHGLPGLGQFLAERAGYFDVVLVSRPHNITALWQALAGRPELLGQARVIYDAEAIYAAREVAQAALAGRPFAPAEAERMVAEEIRRCTAGVHVVTCVTEAESALFRRHMAPEQSLYRLAHAAGAAVAAPGHAPRRGFLFIGRLLEREAPNWRGLSWFIRECWPLVRQALPGAELTVVGQLHPDHAALAVPGVRLLGPVENLQPLYDAARVFLAPVQFAAGVPIKIVEATAAGLPTVCTTLMARQLGWQDADALAVADEAAALATQAVALHEDAAAWQAMLGRAQALLRRDFDPEAFQANLAAALEGRAAPVEATAQSHRLARVEAVWGKAPPTDEAAQWAAYPTSHPVVRGEMNRRATGQPDQDGFGALRELLLRQGQRLPLARAASLCCGTGGLERRLLAEGLLAHCIGYDLAHGALELARAAAQAAGQAAALEYRQCDLEATGLGEQGLDLVLGYQGVHHLSRLEFVFDNVHAALRPGGIFHLQEFVGPDRFQWTDRQVAEMTAWLRSVPERYRRTPEGQVKAAAGRASLAEMLAHDPTEAARSSMIEPLLAERFEILERRPLGGTLAMMALAGIAHNFNPAVAEDVAHLERLLHREAELMATGELGSDFVMITARRRGQLMADS